MNPIAESRKPRNWTRRRINAELMARNLRQADLVHRTGRSQATISLVVAGRRKSQPVAGAIAEALGCQPWDIWPRLYAAPPSEAPSSAPTPEPAAGPTTLAS